MNFSPKRQRVYNRAREVAQLYYEKRGYVPATLTLIVNMTESDEAFLKYNPDQPRVPAGNPDGGQWSNAEGGSNGGNSVDDSNTGPDHEPRAPKVFPASANYPTSQVRSLDDAKRIVREANGKPLGRDNQCASLVHQLAPKLPSTTSWLAGEHVESNTDIPVGTPIATFNFQGKPGTNGYGPSSNPRGLSGFSHTGIYLGQSAAGIEILHQYGNRGPHIETIPWARWNGREDEAGSRYYTIAY